jgi:hypothetical protein
MDGERKKSLSRSLAGEEKINLLVQKLSGREKPDIE